MKTAALDAEVLPRARLVALLIAGVERQSIDRACRYYWASECAGVTLIVGNIICAKSCPDGNNEL